MFSSLRARLWLSYVLLIATALVVVAIVLMLYLIGNPLLHRQTLSRIRAAEGLIMERPEQLLGSHDPSALLRIADTLDVRILVFNTDGSVRSDSQPREPGLHLPHRPGMARRIPSIKDDSGRFWLYTLNALPGGSWLMISAPRPAVPVLSVFADELLLPLLQGAAAAFVLSLVVAFLVSRWIADPLQRLMVAAHRYPADEVRPVAPAGPHEVQDLTRAFNAMMARVQASARSQREFVANVSHELKTPLTSVNGFAQALRDGTADTPEARRQAADVIYNESNRMHRLVLDLLDLARLEAGIAEMRMEAVDVSRLLMGVAEKVKPQAEAARTRVHVAVAEGLPHIAADRDRLEQVLINLVDNAIKYSASGAEIALRAEKAASEMIFEVQDSGEGMSPETVERIFERFYQADPARPGGQQRGAGLGLAIVREIVEAHGGKISVRSQVGRGTTVTVHLPLANSAAARADQTSTGSQG